MRLLSPVLLAALLIAPEATANCAVQKLTSFDAKISSGRIVIDTRIDGQQVWAMLDTGLPYNMISKKLAEALNLPKTPSTALIAPDSMAQFRGRVNIPSLPPTDTAMMDSAGGSATQIATAHTVAFGELKTEDTPFYVMGEPDKNDPRPDIIFGANFLETYDLELDLAHGKVNIFFPDHCPGRVVYWTDKFGSVPIKVLNGGHIILPVAVNGVETHAILDTGAAMSMVSTLLAKSTLGVDPAADGDRPDYVVEPSGAHLPVYSHIFDSFDFGGTQFYQTRLDIAPDRLNRIIMNSVQDPMGDTRHEERINTPVTLGMNHIEKLRLYFSFKEQMLYTTPADAD